nr:hypothetical protein Itr_chr07CG05650 [Ipomoea trifida]
MFHVLTHVFSFSPTFSTLIPICHTPSRHATSMAPLAGALRRSTIWPRHGSRILAVSPRRPTRAFTDSMHATMFTPFFRLLPTYACPHYVGEDVDSASGVIGLPLAMPHPEESDGLTSLAMRQP